jgi:hypothetical protein
LAAPKTTEIWPGLIKEQLQFFPTLIYSLPGIAGLNKFVSALKISRRYELGPGREQTISISTLEIGKCGLSDTPVLCSVISIGQIGKPIKAYTRETVNHVLPLK